MFDFEVVDSSEVPGTPTHPRSESARRLQMIGEIPEGKAAKFRFPDRATGVRARNTYRTLAARHWGTGKLHTRLVGLDNGTYELFLWKSKD
jgi:hypothetical protein